MIPEPVRYLSVLMGAPDVSDSELGGLGVEIVERLGAGLRGLLVPASALEPYRRLIQVKLSPGFWNDLVGPDEVLFLCSVLNGDPLEQTSDLHAYLAANAFYRDAMVAYYGVDRKR